MDGVPAVLRTLDRLYAAALAREQWSVALDHLRDMFAGNHIILATYDLGGSQSPVVLSAGIDQQDRARMLSDEASRMAYPYFAAAPVDLAQPRSAIVSDSDFIRSEFYNEILRPAQGFHAVGAMLRGPGKLMTAVQVCRPEHARAYETADAEILQVLLPHLTMALEIERRLDVAKRRSDGLGHLLNRVAVAAFATDGSARPHFMNTRAEALIAAADGLTLNAMGLAASTPALTRALRAAIAGIAAGNGAGVRLHLTRPSRRLPLRATLIPAHRLEPDNYGVSESAVAILVTEPDAPPPVDKEALADTFRLTRREADIAALLAGGADLPAIAAMLGLGMGTVRNHLKGVFQKTGVNSQAALVALARGFTRLDIA